MGHDDTSRRWGITRISVCLSLCALFVLPLSGCSGCRSDDDAQAKQAKEKAEAEKKKRQSKKKKKPKPDVEELAPLRVLPHPTFKPPRDAKARRKLTQQPIFAKPGHWISASHYARANNRDFHGRITWEPRHRDLTSSGMRPLPLKHAPYRMNASRPVVLSKEQRQAKRIDMTLFLPPQGIESTQLYRYTRRNGFSMSMPARQIRHMPAHQYHFVVLGSQPEVYQSLQSEPSMWMRDGDSGEDLFYRVVLIKPDRQTPLPSNALTWTSIAYLLWDDVDPSLLTPEQQQAMLDWLHWGGQLIVSGPDSLELLRGSFLAPHLPVQGGKSFELFNDQLVELRETWNPGITSRKGSNTNELPLHADKPWSAIELEIPEDITRHQVLRKTNDGKPLIVEQRVGRGRIAVTAFRLRERDLRESWSHFDNFLNGYLLRRPAREFRPPPDDESQLYTGNGETADWVNSAGHAMPKQRTDPQFVTRYRLFSRDAGFKHIPRSEVEAVDIDFYGNPVYDTELRPQEGIGEWDDENPVANSARETIRIAAGIEIPEAKFVVLVLLGYLAVLVPLNWCLFRLIGRVEWAWIAAPLISIGGALAVIHLAQLDIGFVRSRTELAVVELQQDYSRAHVTRYTALYTSLSTQYEMEFADSGALVQPFPMQIQRTPYNYDGNDTVHYRSQDRVGLDGFHVISNSTGVLHSEQMVDLGGSISLTHDAGGQIKVSNHTTLPLSAVAVVRRKSASHRSKPFHIAMIGNLDAGDTAPGTLAPIDADSWFRQWAAEVDRAKLQGSGNEVAWQWLLNPAVALPQVRVARETMLKFGDMKPGDTRLIAIMADREIAGLTITPAASQTRHATLVIANLAFAHDTLPRPDQNAPQSRKRGENPDRGFFEAIDAFDNTGGLVPGSIPSSP